MNTKTYLSPILISVIGGGDSPPEDALRMAEAMEKALEAAAQRSKAVAK